MDRRRIWIEQTHRRPPSQKLISTPPIGVKSVRSPLSLRGTKAEKNANAEPATLTLIPGTTSTIVELKRVVVVWKLLGAC
ncbi:MAG: hypothetical protein ABW298_17325 [Candidatus Binatia bacterium]